jgi:hypothetical protein
LGLLGQRLAALALAVNVAGQLPSFQHRFGLGRPIGGIGPDSRVSVLIKRLLVSIFGLL